MLKSLTRRGFIALFAALAVLAVGLCTIVPAEAHAATEGWKHDSKGFWYQYANGSYPRNAWVQEEGDGIWFYFNKAGYAHEGWLKKDGKWYYLADILNMYKDYLDSDTYNSIVKDGTKDGFVAKIGGKTKMAPCMLYSDFYLINGKWYYFNGSGAMQTGWKKIDGDWYFFAKSGAMQFDWVKSGGKWYYMDADGIMQTGWQKIGGQQYYMNGSGVMVTGWQKISGKWYYFNKSGAMQAKKWIGNYYVQDDGTMATNKWIGKYHVDKNGKWDKTK